jgi:hypothetical protein
MIQYHFQLRGDKIVCWNGNDGWTEIATVIEGLERPCRHLLRNAQFVEDLEQSVDTMLGAVANNMRSLMKDTSGQSREAPCPELPLAEKDNPE